MAISSSRHSVSVMPSRYGFLGGGFGRGYMASATEPGSCRCCTTPGVPVFRFGNSAAAADGGRVIGFRPDQLGKETTQPAQTPSHQEELNHRQSVERWLGRQLRLVEIQD
jgi:hypothetical protein